MLYKTTNTLRERGKFKLEIHNAFYKSDDLKELILGDTSGKKTTEVMKEFKDHVKSHLFVDDTITETGTFIYYDVLFPYLKEHIKTCQVVMYAICHRDILEDYYKDGYVGNRADILAELIEDVLLNSDVVGNFGIGNLTLDGVSIYNSVRFYGTILTFSVPNFRCA